METFTPASCFKRTVKHFAQAVRFWEEKIPRFSSAWFKYEATELFTC